MSTPHLPRIPLRLANRPTVGGLVVPWITARTPDGRYRFGATDHRRQQQAVTHLLCQTCGTRLDHRIVFAMRDADLRLFISPEPGMHPECAAYTATACPMLAGHMTHYRSSPLVAQLAADPAVHIQYGDPGGARVGHRAERWHLLWATGYRPVTHPLTHQPAALVPPDRILRTRPIATARRKNKQ